MNFKTEYDFTNIEETLKRESLNFYEKIEEDSSSSNEDSGLSTNSKKIQKRKTYSKIDNETRLKIIEEVQKNGKLLKMVAEKYNVNYSSAKSIFHVYRKEGRILKKPFKGRSAKTVLQLNNPIVFVTLPTATTPPSLCISQAETPNRNPQQMWQQLPPIDSLTLSRQVNKETGSPQIVSILHPSQASMLQNLCTQAVSGHNMQVNQAVMKENMTVQKSVTADKKWEQFGNINREIPSIFNNYQYQQYQNAMNCPQADRRLMVQAGQNSPQDLMKASLLNQWIQSQWKTVNTGF